MKESRITGSLYLPKFVAEGEGFEPPKPCGSPVFKTSAFNLSAIPPKEARKILYTISRMCAGRNFHPVGVKSKQDLL